MHQLCTRKGSGETLRSKPRPGTPLVGMYHTFRNLYNAKEPNVAY